MLYGEISYSIERFYDSMSKGSITLAYLSLHAVRPKDFWRVSVDSSVKQQPKKMSNHIFIYQKRDLAIGTYLFPVTMF